MRLPIASAIKIDATRNSDVQFLLGFCGFSRLQRHDPSSPLDTCEQAMDIDALKEIASKNGRPGRQATGCGISGVVIDVFGAKSLPAPGTVAIDAALRGTMTPASLVAAADAALYRAKSGGRDRVEGVGV
jgi:hypothetical protein